MLTLDHIVVHVDGDDITQLKSELDRAGLPFEPDWGKKAKGFKVANVWIGRQYVEIVNILAPDNLWQPQWSARHARGDRGVYCLFLKTDQDFDDLHAAFTRGGVHASQPERTRFKWMFGLLEKKLPWRFMLLPPVPGTPVELGVIQYDRGAEAKFRPFMVPNAEDKGLLGLEKATVVSGNRDEACAWLENLSRILGQALPLNVGGDGSQGAALHLTPRLAPGTDFPGVKIANVQILGGTAARNA